MPRHHTVDHFFIMEIERLMFDEGMTQKPTEIHDYFVNELKAGNQKYSGHPIRLTISRHMGRIRRVMDYATRGVVYDVDKSLAAKYLERFTQYKKREEFHYPGGIGDKDNQIPRKYADYARDCLKLYRKVLGVYPSVGLTQRFVDVAIDTQEPKGFSDTQRAILAERFWYADLMESIPDRDRPSTRYEELYIEKRARYPFPRSKEAWAYFWDHTKWDADPLVIPEKDFRITTSWLPYFNAFGPVEMANLLRAT
jgi:hypothetical protein